MRTVDLTPFGFTPTETRVYSALLARGPTSAYGLAKVLSVARANVYQALNGLVSKRAAVLVADNPQVFRPVGAAALLALIAEDEARKLDRLESQVRAWQPPGQPATIGFTGKRSFGELALRSAVRADSILCIAPGELLSALAPVWRKRAADGAETLLWMVGSTAPHDLPIPAIGIVSPERVRSYFGAPAVLLLAPVAVILGRWTGHDELSGHWSSDPILIGTARAAAHALTRA